MPIDINEDRRLRVTWFKYENMLKEHERSRKTNWKEGTMGEWNQIRKNLEYARRTEMLDIRKQVRKEKKEREEKEQLEAEKEAEKRRMKRELRKKEQAELSPPPLRRSARVHKKTSNDPLSIYKYGSMYTKTA